MYSSSVLSRRMDSSWKGVAFAIFAMSALFFMLAPRAEAAITSVHVTAPNGGEVWGVTKNITWASTNDGSDGTVNIYYCHDASCLFGGNVPIATGTPNVGTYSWDTSAVPAGSDYKIRVRSSIDSDVGDYSDAVFTLDHTAPSAPGTPAAAAGPVINAAEYTAGINGDKSVILPKRVV